MWITVAIHKTPVGFHKLWSMFEPDFSGSVHTPLPTPVLLGWSTDLPRGAVRPKLFLPETQRRQNKGARYWTERLLCWETGLAFCHEVRPPEPSPLFRKEMAVRRFSVPGTVGSAPSQIHCLLLLKVSGLHLQVEPRSGKYCFWGKGPHLVRGSCPWVPRAVLWV